ncbi:MAG: MFS transporter [Planctomycetaceae bacterium]|nr:MFS transporter [Planctomycetaceae bacterium]
MPDPLVRDWRFSGVTALWSLRQARVAIIIAGCLGTAYTQLTTSAASIEFTRALGGNGLHVGILNAIPTGMLFMQFVAAWCANKLDYRRPLWFWLTVLQRLLLIPFAAGPWLFPEVPTAVWLWAFLGAFAVNQGLAHFTTPLWLSWMGDYLPREGLSTFWGVRQLWMQITAAATLLGSGVWLWQSGLDMQVGFAVIVAVGGILGVIDLCLFIKVDEPRVTKLPAAGLWEVVSGPFRHAGFRSFIGFMCFWHFAAMVGAPFISLYLLQYVGMDLFQVLVLWTFSWLGGAISSRWLGHAADHFGNRPVLILCVGLKSINMISLLFVPREPILALTLLAPVFMVDMALNTGVAIATNGYLLKHSPAANRTMFIASGTAVAGLVGGVTAIVCGAWLSWVGDWSLPFPGRPLTGFHVLFLTSLLLRFVAVALVSSVQEPEVKPTMHVISTLMGVGPIRVLRYPVGLYRRYVQNEAATTGAASAAERSPNVRAKSVARSA